MNREDIGKLLGGYAAGTLTPEEQEALYAAALEDQELFDALAHEQSLRDLLRDPAAKAQVLAALDQPKPGWFTRWWRPAALATASIAAAALILIAVYPKPQQTKLVAILDATSSAVSQQQKMQELAVPPADRPPAKIKRAKQREVPAATGGVVGGVPRAVPPGVAGDLLAPAPSLPAAPPPPPPAKQEFAMPAIPPPAATAENLQVLKAMADINPGARDLFRQNISLPSQFLEKDASAEQQASGKARFGAAQGLSKTIASTGPVGVRYTVLPEGDSQSIRFEPNVAGRIAVWARPAAGAWRIVQSSSISVLMPITVKLAAGETEVAVWFSRDASSRAQSEPPALTGPAANLRMEGPRAGDNASYAASPNPGMNEIRFNIKLN